MSRHVRRLIRADAPAYRALRAYALERFPPAFTSHISEEAAKPLAWYEERIAPTGNPRHFVLGTFDGEKLSGIAGLTAEQRRNEAHKATVFGVTVHEGWQRRGIGEALMRQLVSDARALPGLRQLMLSVTETCEAARRLYERLGFETYGIEPRANIVNGHAIDKRLMVLVLMDGDRHSA